MKRAFVTFVVTVSAGFGGMFILQATPAQSAVTGCQVNQCNFNPQAQLDTSEVTWGEKLSQSETGWTGPTIN